MRLVILMPVYNDWKSCGMLIERLESTLSRHELAANILLIDDGSHQESSLALNPDANCIENISILRLKRNLGHQKAIAIGLAYLEDRIEYDVVIIMDADGQDSAEDVPRLLDKLSEHQNQCIVFAKRGKRLENASFQVGYLAYKWLHYLLTGHKVRFGNFSAMPASLVKQIVVTSELWNHYVAAAVIARLPYTFIPADRARRLAGHSQMNLLSLAIHGLRALSAFSDIVTLRLLLTLGTFSLIGLSSTMVLLALKYLCHHNVPIWLMVVDGVVAFGTLQTFLLVAVLAFALLDSRSKLGMLPLRDYGYLIHTSKDDLGKGTFRCNDSSNSRKIPRRGALV